MYSLVMDFQSLIVGGLGFSGVVITLLVNARMLRKQHENIRLEQIESIQTALHTELGIIDEAMSSNIINFNKDENSVYPNFYLPICRMDQAFRTLLADLGKLPPDQVRDIMYAYLTYDSYLSSLKLLGEISESHPDHIVFNSNQSKAVNGMSASVQRTTQKGLESIKRGA